GAGMFAEAPVAASGDTAALIGGRRQLYARDLLAIPALGGGADNIALPKRQRGRRGAGAGERPGIGVHRLRQLHGVAITAAIGFAHVGRWLGLKARAAKG